MQWNVAGLFMMLMASIGQASTLFAQDQEANIQHKLQVQVVDHAGHPVANVRVLPWVGAYLGEEGFTDDAGFVSLEPLSGYGGLAIVAPNRIAEFAPMTLGADVVTIVLQKGQTITGQVNFPVKKAQSIPKEISLLGPSGEYLPSLPFSVSYALEELEIFQGGCDLPLDEEGRFHVEGIYQGWDSSIFFYPEGVVQLVEGDVESDEDWGESIILTSATEHVVMDFIAMPRVSGRLLTVRDGAPIEDAIIDVEIEIKGFDEPLSAFAFNDADGSFEGFLELPEGEMLQAWRNGTLALKPSSAILIVETFDRPSGIEFEFDLTDRQNPFDFGDIHMEQEGTFGVRVVDAQGAPVANAAVDADAIGEHTDEAGYVLVLPGEEPETMIVGAPGYRTTSFPLPGQLEEITEVVLEKDTNLVISWQLPKHVDLDDLVLSISNPDGETILRREMQLMREARIRFGYGISWRHERNEADAEPQSDFEYWLSTGINEVHAWGFEANVPLEISLLDQLGNQILKTQTIELKEQEHRTVEMEVNFIPRVLRGRVVDEDGATITEGELFFGDLEGDYEAAYMTEAGDFEITGLATEKLDLVIVVDGFDDVVLEELSVPADGMPIDVVMKAVK
jgi:hypothetical protein